MRENFLYVKFVKDKIVVRIQMINDKKESVDQ